MLRLIAEWLARKRASHRQAARWAYQMHRGSIEVRQFRGA